MCGSTADNSYLQCHKNMQKFYIVLYSSMSCFRVKDVFWIPFLTFEKARPFIMVSAGLQVFPSASLFRVTQESQTMFSVLVLRRTNENKLSLPLFRNLRYLDFSCWYFRTSKLRLMPTMTSLKALMETGRRWWKPWETLRKLLCSSTGLMTWTSGGMTWRRSQLTSGK